MTREAECFLGVQRHQVLVVEFFRGLEEHALAVACAACLGAGCPCGVACGCVEHGSVGCFVLLPLQNGLRKAEFGLSGGAELRARGIRIEAREIGVLDFRERETLHEKTFHGVERGERVVARGKRLRFGLYAEEPGDEVFEMRGQRDQELGFGLAGEAVWLCARCCQRVPQRRVGCVEMREESGVQTMQAIARVEVLELQAEGERKHVGEVPVEQQGIIRARARRGNLGGRGHARDNKGRRRTAPAFRPRSPAR